MITRKLIKVSWNIRHRKFPEKMDYKNRPFSSCDVVTVAAASRHCSVALSTEPQHIVGGGTKRPAQSDAVDCGTESQPWSIDALAGQRIAISLSSYGNFYF
jgi:hypothetical protein